MAGFAHRPPVNECYEPTLQITALVCAAKVETCVGTHVAFGNVALECEAVGQYAGKVKVWNVNT